MRYINILHLSDLHLKPLGAERFNQSRVIEALKRDLTELKRGHLKPDLLIFSGDLANSADDRLYSDVTDVIAELAASAGLADEQVIIAYGNHDAHRSIVSKNAQAISEWRNRNSSPTDMNALFFDDALISYVGNGFKDAMAAASKFGPPVRMSNAFFRCHYLKQYNLGIVCINTAILGGAGLDALERDERRLLYPEIALLNALNELPEDCMKVVVGHHPIEFLQEICANSLRTTLMKSADFYLFGHMHEANPTSIHSAIGQCVFIQAGALYASREWWNGYSIVSVVPGQPHPRLTLRRWHEARLGFGVASELDDFGIVYLSEEGRQFWKDITPKFGRVDLETWRQQVLLPELERECCQSLTKQSLDSVYVAPEFERELLVEGPDAGGIKLPKTEILSLTDLMNGNDNLIVSAPSESGKTALIRNWAYGLARGAASSSHWTIPVMINFLELKEYQSAIETAVKKRLHSLPEGVTANALLESGLVTIFVDDVRLEHSRRKDAVAAFVAKFSMCRYIFLTSTPFLQGAGITPVISENVSFTSVKMRRIKASQLLSLIEKHGTTDPQQADKLLQRMIVEAASLSVPITPVTGTFLIQIYTEDGTKPLINRANLLERYVEISLEKFGSADLLPGAFDFHNKADLLSDIAQRMCKADQYEIDDAGFISWMDSYLKRFGLKYSPIDLLDYFTEARLLERKGGMVGFRLRAFLEYFVARRMDSDEEFRDWILHEDRYLSFSSEIAFYAAISRRDKTWMEELFSRFRSQSETIWEAASDEVRTASLLETFEVPSSEASEADVLEIERRILDNDLLKEDRLERLQDDVPGADCHQKVRRKRITDPGEKWFGQLTLLSSMLKNMELIDDGVKTEVLSEVINGWLQFTSLSLGLVPALAKDKTMTVAGVKYEVHFPGELDIGEIARRLFIVMPISVARFAHQHIGTEKLQLQLEKGLGESTKRVSAGQQFMRSSLLAQLGSDGAAAQLRKVAPQLVGHRYLQEVFLRQLYELVVRYRLSDGELVSIRRLAADVATRLERTPGKQIARRKSGIIKSLTRSRMIVEIDPDEKERVGR